MKIGWVLGWAVSREWFARLARDAFPDAQHCFIEATPLAMARLERGGPFDRVVGYSLGAHLLLASADHAWLPAKIALLAPIFAFPREAHLGGRASRTQVRHLARWLRRDPLPALADFHARAQLDPIGISPPWAAMDDLLWGLERLENGRVDPPLPGSWRAWCGAEDALLDATRLSALVPELRVVSGATHHPAGLLRAMAREMP